MNHSNLSRRPRSNPAERAQWVERFVQSGLTVREFAVRHGFKFSTLQRWIYQNPQPAIAPAFTEVKMSPPKSRWAVEMVRADGSIVRLAHDAPMAWLQQLAQSC